MRIYNKRGLLMGIGLLLMGGLDVYLNLTGPATDWPTAVKDWGVVIVCMLAGGVMMRRAFSRRAAHADRVDDRDERNQLVRLKSNDRTLKLLLAVLVVVSLLTLVATHGTASAETRGLLTGMALTVGLTFWLWLGSSLYYEHKL
ncbi:hypothetical protein [Lacticaseibacillus daqingensis]|uniref:hypothetical protein n=1 Tax=Lacticaseibacillus daqingensis TaxID=2486014 RepID=UPI000F7ACFCB|nr:hypothetical protein [Lacticaseibacillus daqingensis]